MLNEKVKHRLENDPFGGIVGRLLAASSADPMRAGVDKKRELVRFRETPFLYTPAGKHK